jgi:hypothetical protein
MLFINCSCWLICWAKAVVSSICWVKLSCKHEGVLEEMLNLIHNILTKKVIHYEHLDMWMMTLHFRHEVPYCEYVN